MTKLKILVLAGLLIVSSHSCEKEDLDPFKTIDAVLLEIDPDNNSYIGADGNDFYSNSFESKNDTTFYKLKVVKGVKYSISCNQKGIESIPIEMILFNSGFDTITYSNNTNGKPNIIFESNVDDYLFLSVYVNGRYIESLNYNLYFKIDDSSVELNDILLEINPTYNSYVDDNGKHYYQNTFSKINSTNIYRLKVESGVYYYMSCIQPDARTTPINMALLNSQMDTLSYSYRNDGIPEIVFKPSTNDDLFLHVTFNSIYNTSLDYNLYFEKHEPLHKNFKNYDWEYTGNWELNNSDSIVFKTIDARRYRWLRLNSYIETNPKVSFTLKSKTKTELPSFGFVFEGSTKIFDWGSFIRELPSYGTFFHIENDEEFEIVEMRGTGASFNHENLKLPPISMTDGIEFEIVFTENGSYDYYSIIINGTGVKEIYSPLMNKFYIVFEDIGNDEFVIENLNIE